MRREKTIYQKSLVDLDTLSWECKIKKSQGYAKKKKVLCLTQMNFTHLPALAPYPFCCSPWYFPTPCPHLPQLWLFSLCLVHILRIAQHFTWVPVLSQHLSPRTFPTTTYSKNPSPSHSPLSPRLYPSMTAVLKQGTLQGMLGNVERYFVYTQLRWCCWHLVGRVGMLLSILITLRTGCPPQP